MEVLGPEGPPGRELALQVISLLKNIFSLLKYDHKMWCCYLGKKKLILHKLKYYRNIEENLQGIRNS